MPNNLTIQVQADNTKLQADLAVTKELFRQAAKEVRDTAKEAAAGGDKQPLQDAVAQANELAGRMKFLQGAIAATHGEHRSFLGTLREAGTGLRELGARALEFGVVLREVGDRIFPHFREIAAISIGAATAELVHLVLETNNAVVHTANLARAFGISIGDFEALRLSAAQAGVDPDALSAGLGIFFRRVGEAREAAAKLTGEINPAVATLHGSLDRVGDSAAVARGGIHDLTTSASTFVQVMRGGNLDKLDFSDPFKALRINVNDFKDNAEGNIALLIEFAKRIDALGESAIKNQIAQRALGRGYRETFAFLKELGPAFRAAQHEIEHSNLGILPGDEAQARSFKGSLETMRFYIDRVKEIFGVEFGRGIQPFFDAIKRTLIDNAAGIREWAQALGSSVGKVALDFADILKGARGGAGQPPLRTDFAANFVSAAAGVKSAIAGIGSALANLRGVLDPIARGFNAVFGTNFSGIGLGITAAVFGMAGGFRVLAAAIGLARVAFLLFLNNPILLLIFAIAEVAIRVYENWGKIGPVVQDLWNKFKQLADFVIAGLAPAFDTAWDAAASGIKTVLGWVDTLLQKLSKALDFVKSLGGGGAAAGGDITQTTSSGLAGGGWVHGPGTGTSDSVLIRASAGEHVTNERQASRFRPLLDAINSGSLAVRGFASGGWVGEAFSGLMPHSSIPAYAGGGRVSSDGAALHLHIGDRSYEAHAPQRTLEDLAHAARYSDTVSLGRKPSTMYGSR